MLSNPWKEVLLEDVADEITVGYVGPMASEYVTEGIPFLRSQNVEPLVINQNDIKYITPEFHDKIKKSALRPGDVVIVRTGKPGATAVIPDWLPISNCSDLVIIRSGKKLDSRFLAYYINAIAGQHVSAHLVGAVQQHFNVGSARKIQINLPDINEQRAITEILGALDDKIELNRRMNRTLESMARAVFRQWFVEDEEVESWDIAPLSSICESIFSGGTPSTTKPEYWNGRIPWLSSGETRDRFIIDTEKTITQAGVNNSSTRFARLGSTVIASAGQGKTRGQTSLLMFDTYINQSVVVLNANKELISDLFLFFGLSGRYEEFRQLSDSHSSRGSLTTKLLGGVQISVPPFEKVLEFDKFARPIVEQIHQNLLQSCTLASLRDSLLPKLMRGEVRVKEL